MGLSEQLATATVNGAGMPRRVYDPFATMSPAGCYHRVVDARLPLIVVLALSAATAATQLQAPSPASDESALDVTDIIGLAVARARAQDEAGVELGFESTISTIVEKLNGDGDIVASDTTEHRRYALEGSLYEELISRNGEPVSESDIRDESERRQKFQKEARKATDRGEHVQTNDERQIRFNDDLMTRFTATIVGQEMMRGHRCWVIAFQPRSDKLPGSSRLDKALNRSAGHVYVTQSDYGVVRIDFELLRPVRYLWGIVASLRKATGQLEFERVDDGIWLPRSFDLYIDVRVLFRTTRRHVVRQWIERNRVRQPATTHRQSRTGPGPP